MELINQKLGSVGEAKVEFVGMALQASVSAKVTVDEILVALEKAIPGDVDNKIIDGLRAILSKVEAQAAAPKV